MPVSDHTSPSQDLAAWQASRAESGILTADLVALIQGGVAVSMGVRSTDGRPLVGSGVAARIERSGTVRALISETRNRALLDALAAGSPIAATFSRARDHRSIQVKAPRAQIAALRPGDLCEVARQCAVLADELVELGYTRPQAEAYHAHDPDDLVSVEFLPERVFTQTPGPGAGTEMSR